MLLPGKSLFACYASQSAIMELPSACGRQNNESWIFFFFWPKQRSDNTKSPLRHVKNMTDVGVFKKCHKKNKTK